MSGEGNLRALPTDLILKIFLRFSSKSIARCRCVSKLWGSLLRSQNFTELFLTQSATRPRLLFTFQRKNNELCLYSCPQPQISDKNPQSSPSVTAEFHMSLLNYHTDDMSPSISGLICATRSQVLLCNPSTRQSLRLPLLPSSKLKRSYFGYDPIDKQFSVLAICESLSDSDLSYSYRILKLGSGNLSWRSLDCPLHYCPYGSNVCIDGTLYFYHRAHQKIACFDLNSEDFKFIDQPWCWMFDQPNLFVNFKGKLGGIYAKWEDIRDKKPEFELSLWVLEDVTKQEWSKHVYFVPSRLIGNAGRYPPFYNILGLTGKGDIVFALPHTFYPFYVVFFNLEKRSLQKVEIKGLEEFFKDYDVEGKTLVDV